MKLYTIIINFIYGNSSYQISANSIREALHQLFDTRKMEGVGPKALRQLHADIDSELWKPTGFVDMTNIWLAQYRVNNEDMYVYIVLTREERDPDDTSEALKYTDGYCTNEQLRHFNKHIERLEDKANWKALKRYLTSLCKLYPREYYLMTKLARCCYLVGEPEQMLQWARRAYQKWSRDLITVYWLALACYENSLWQEAISHSDTILQWDFRNLAYGPHGDGADYAWQLISDCNAVKGLSLLALNRPEGRQYLQKYLQRAREQTSWFSRAYVRRRLQQG